MGLCEKQMHLYLKKGVYEYCSVYLGNDSPVDSEVALTAECEGNCRICSTFTQVVSTIYLYQMQNP
jgi:hypothetical protein